MREVVGLDVGGANTKLCLLTVNADGTATARGVSRYHEVWRHPDGLTHLVVELLRQVSPAGRPHAVGMTMTAELCDVFPTKEAGVTAIIAAVERAFPQSPLWLWTVGGNFVPGASRAGTRPPYREVAAANWSASASLMAAASSYALLIDIGSTTTDVIPLVGGQVVARGHSDLERLAWGELLYTGILRTPLHSLSDHVFVRGAPCRVTHELFTITADVYRLLGLIAEEEYNCATPDARGRDPAACWQRLARLVAADREDLDASTLTWMARYLKECQLQLISRCVFQVLSGLQPPAGKQDPLLIAAGQGAFLVKEIGNRLGLPCQPWWNLVRTRLAPPGSWTEPIALTAFAVAVLLAAHLDWYHLPFEAEERART